MTITVFWKVPQSLCGVQSLDLLSGKKIVTPGSCACFLILLLKTLGTGKLLRALKISSFTCIALPETNSHC